MMEFFRTRSSKHLLYLALVLGIGLFLRWYQLDVRAMHHDESLHATYGTYFYTAPDRLYYKYDPMLHGPLMYHALPYAFDIFGNTGWAARSLTAILGSLLMLVPLFYYRRLSARNLLVATTLVALSPSLIYWSRFIREDLFMLASLILALLAQHFFTGRWKLFGAIVFFLTGLCIKENFFVHLALGLGFLAYDAILGRKTSFVALAASSWKSHWKTVVLALAASAFIYFYFYTAGFRYADGLTQNMLIKGISYWIHQHNIERIPGPFIYPFLILSWYDFLFTLLALAQVAHFYFKQWRAGAKYLIVFTLAFAVGHLAVDPASLVESGLFKALKLKLPVDFFLFAFLIFHSLAVTTFYLRKNQRGMAFAGYLFTSSLFSYSFVGEKVPWLAMYPLLAGIAFLAMYWESLGLELGQKTFQALLALLFVFNLRMAVKVNFSEAGSDNQLISQVHTTQQFQKIVYKIKDAMDYPLTSMPPTVLAMGDSIWPLSWYFYSMPGYSYFMSKDVKSYDYIFADYFSPDLDQNLPGHDKLMVPMRWWWVPDYENLTLFQYFRYALTQNPWNEPGKMNVALYVRKK